MRIAIDATYSVDPHPSGIGVYSQELLKQLPLAFPDNEYLYCYRWKQWRRSTGPLPAHVRRRLLQPPLPTFHADLFHALNQRVDRRSARKVVSTFHDLFVITGNYSSREFKDRFTQQARRAAENSDLIIAVSHFTARQVTDLLRVEPSRIRVVPHGVAMPATTSTTKRENMILSVGTLQSRKNTSRLVEAFEGLPSQWQLVLAGSPNGYGSAEILSRIESSPSKDRILVTGYLSAKELQQFYQRASLFAFPSMDEGFGIPVLEAMSYGIPVVTSNKSAMPEVTGDAALLVDPRRTDDLRTALKTLTENESLREKLGEAGRMRACLFSWERAVRETYAVYRELVS